MVVPFTETEILAKKERPATEAEQVQLLILCHLKVAFTKDCFTSCKEHQNITAYYISLFWGLIVLLPIEILKFKLTVNVCASSIRDKAYFGRSFHYQTFQLSTVHSRQWKVCQRHCYTIRQDSKMN